MTREEWEHETNPDKLLDALTHHVPDRQYFLYASTALKLLPEPLSPEQQSLFTMLEWVGQQQTNRQERRGFVEALGSVFRGDIGGAFGAVLGALPLGSRLLARNATALLRQVQAEDHPGINLSHCELIREILGPPESLTTWDDAWKTETVQELARTILADDAWDKMPILADSLEEAGCTCDVTLTHARNMNTGHHTGCWLLARVLTKEAESPKPSAFEKLLKTLGTPMPVT